MISPSTSSDVGVPVRFVCIEPIGLPDHHRLLRVETGEELQYTRDTEKKRKGQGRRQQIHLVQL